jgi:hypothetical protein
MSRLPGFVMIVVGRRTGQRLLKPQGAPPRHAGLGRQDEFVSGERKGLHPEAAGDAQ